MGDTRTYNLFVRNSLYNVDFGGHVRKLSKDSCRAGGYYDNKGQYVDVSYNSDRGIYEAKINGEFPNYSSSSSSGIPIPPVFFNVMSDMNERSSAKSRENRIAFLQEQAQNLKDQESSRSDTITYARKKAAEQREKQSQAVQMDQKQIDDRIAMLREQANKLRGE